MTPIWDRRVRTACALLACACAGALGDGLLRMKYVRNEPGVRDLVERPAIVQSAEPASRAPASAAGRERTPERALPLVTGTAGALSATGLRMPVDGVDVESLKGGFAERRGSRAHEAVDILAPRNTPILAVENGTVAKLFDSKAGGLTIYQYDPSARLAYYYAHLERYADGLHDGQVVSQGDVLGYVGTSGNAPSNTPHLHFGVFELDNTHRWWKGKAIDPYLVFKSKS
jgi:murein DD-endopeptidase MepM/ murein hydrolase activator NlpD